MERAFFLIFLFAFLSFVGVLVRVVSFFVYRCAIRLVGLFGRQSVGRSSSRAGNRSRARFFCPSFAPQPVRILTRAEIRKNQKQGVWGLESGGANRAFSSPSYNS